VTDEGMDIIGRSSVIIAPHGLCSIWIPNEKEKHYDSSSERERMETSHKNLAEESTPGVSASFSCEICNKSFPSRAELRQHA
jgi:C2H2-type zinc finger protein